MEYLWGKIKTYLTSWKVSNFGSGTYSNSGTIECTGMVNLGCQVAFGKNNVLVIGDSSGIALRRVSGNSIEVRNSSGSTVNIRYIYSSSISSQTISNGQTVDLSGTRGAPMLIWWCLSTS